MSSGALGTSPLRPPRGRQPELAQWLSSRSRAICESWIARVHAYPPSSSGRALEPPPEAQLRQIYDALCTGLENGRFAPLDEALTGLARDGHRRGHRLTDLQYMIIALNDQVWEATAAEFLPEQVARLMHALTSVTHGALAHVARIYIEEVQAAVSADLAHAQRRLAQLDRAKSSFIGVAAHELRTPITLIQGYSDILLSDFIDAHNERAVQIARGLASGAKRLLYIVNDMIAVSMIDNQMLALHFQPTSLAHVIRIAVSDLKNDMVDRDLAIEVGPMPPGLQSFYADPQRLYDALGHVIGNSIKYTPDGGQISIQTRLLSPGQGEESVVEIAIADNGIGIAPEHQERIFERFFGTADVMRHTSGRTKYKGGGAGLGLVIAKGIVDAHGGKIWIESPGHDEVRRPGTTCRILLPMRTSPPEPRDRLHLDLEGGSA